MNKKVCLRINRRKLCNLQNCVTSLCRLVNDRVKPSLETLGLFDKDKVLYYAEDSERVYADYKAKCMEGAYHIPVYIQRMAEDKINNELYDAIGDGWGQISIDSEMQKCVEWRETENGLELREIPEIIKELCQIYVQPNEMERYEGLKAICEELNRITEGKEQDHNIIICTAEGQWKINENINLKELI